MNHLKLRPAAYEANKDQNDPVALYKESIYGGDPRKGGMIFYTNNSAQCIRCHIHNEMGGEVGPNLTKVATILSPEQLLESLVAPNARIAPGYGSVILGLNNEEKVSGVLIDENDSFLTIRKPDGDTLQIAKSEILERENAPFWYVLYEGHFDESRDKRFDGFFKRAKVMHHRLHGFTQIILRKSV